MFLRFSVTRRFASATLVNAPPTTTVSPTRASDHTVPSRTCGVQSTGLVETTAGWARSAVAGAAVASTGTATATAAAAASRRRMGMLLGSANGQPINESPAQATLPSGVDHEVGGPFQVVPERGALRL